MGRAILGVILGYVVMAVVVMVAFSLAWLILGAEGSFKPGVYDVSAAWIVVSIVTGFVAAVIGGFTCAAIARSATPPKVLAAIVVVLGLALALPTITGAGDRVPKARPESISMFDASANAEQPLWIALLNPLIGAAGILVGARIKGGSRGETSPA